MKIRADRRVGLMLAGVIVLVFLSIGATVVLPASDPDVHVEERKLTAEQGKGFDVYRSEGLWNCDPAYIRETTVDGHRTGRPATTAADVSGMSPVMLGLERTGTHGLDAKSMAKACGVGLSEAEADALQAFLTMRLGQLE